MLLVSTPVKDKIFGRALNNCLHILEVTGVQRWYGEGVAKFPYSDNQKMPDGMGCLEQKELIVDRSFMNRW